MSDIVIVDNFLDDEDFSFIRSIVMGYAFPWHLTDKVSWGEKPPELGDWKDKSDMIDKYNYQLSHLFYYKANSASKTSPYHQRFFCFLKKINASSLIKFRATLNHRTEIPLLLGRYHQDLENEKGFSKGRTGIYYCNSNNGYTSFLSGEKVESVANRFVHFPNDMLHAAVSCTNQRYRIQLNINYLPKEK